LPMARFEFNSDSTTPANSRQKSLLALSQEPGMRLPRRAGPSCATWRTKWRNRFGIAIQPQGAKSDGYFQEGLADDHPARGAKPEDVVPLIARQR
jgi:hypothetical protein